MRQLFQQPLLSAAANGTGAWFDVNSAAEHLTFYVEWSAGGAGGVLVLEHAQTPTSPVAAIQTLTQAAADVADVVQVFGSYQAIRARLSTPVTGGTVSVTVVGATAAH